MPLPIGDNKPGNFGLTDRIVGGRPLLAHRVRLQYLTYIDVKAHTHGLRGEGTPVPLPILQTAPAGHVRGLGSGGADFFWASAREAVKTIAQPASVLILVISYSPTLADWRQPASTLKLAARRLGVPKSLRT